MFFLVDFFCFQVPARPFSWLQNIFFVVCVLASISNQYKKLVYLHRTQNIPPRQRRIFYANISSTHFLVDKAHELPGCRGVDLSDLSVFRCCWEFILWFHLKSTVDTWKLTFDIFVEFNLLKAAGALFPWSTPADHADSQSQNNQQATHKEKTNKGRVEKLELFPPAADEPLRACDCCFFQHW